MISLTVALHHGLLGELLLRAGAGGGGVVWFESIVSVLKGDLVSDVLKLPADTPSLRLKPCSIILNEKPETDQRPLTPTIQRSFLIRLLVLARLLCCRATIIIIIIIINMSVSPGLPA